MATELDVDAVELEVRGFLHEVLGTERDGADPLVADEVDSLVLEQLIAHLEDTFRILLHEQEVDRTNFSSSRRIAEVVVANVRTSPFHP